MQERQNLLLPDNSSNMGVCLMMTRIVSGSILYKIPVSSTFCDTVCCCFYIQAVMVSFLDCDSPYYLKLRQIAREENSEVVSSAVISQ